MSIIFAIITAVLGFVGFWIADKIIAMKKKPEPITCPVGYSCDEVIRGEYSTFFGVSTVSVGRLFYLAISSFFLVNLFIEMPRVLVFIVLLIAGLALLFSVYLVAVQLFVIKKWCSWCLFSALINLLIFIAVFVGFSSLFADFLFDFRHLLSWLFVAATLVGTVATSFHAFTFIKFLRDFEISRKEYRRLGMLSQTAWASIAITFLSALGLVLSDSYREITGNSEFLVMGIIVGVLVVYELVQNMIIAPRLMNVHFGDHPELDDAEHSYQRKLAFAFVAVGVVSWYLLMMFANISWHEYQPMTLIWIYLIAVLAAVAISLLAERVIYRKSLKKEE